MNAISSAGIFAAGALVGAAAAYFILKERFKLEKDEEYRAMEKHLQDIYRPSEAVEQTRKDVEEVVEKIDKIITPYNKVSGKEETITNNKKSDEVILAESQSPVEITDDVFEISFGEYESSESMHDHIELTYYEGDQVVTDDADDPIEPGEVLNEECIEHFASSTKNVMHFRDMRNGCDYEITRALGSYGDRLGEI